MNGVASQYVCWQKTTSRMTKAYVRQEPRTRLNRVLLSPVDGLKPSSARRFLASVFSSSERKRGFVRSGMSGNMKKPLIQLVDGILGVWVTYRNATGRVMMVQIMNSQRQPCRPWLLLRFVYAAAWRTPASIWPRGFAIQNRALRRPSSFFLYQLLRVSIRWSVVVDRLDWRTNSQRGRVQRSRTSRLIRRKTSSRLVARNS